MIYGKKPVSRSRSVERNRSGDYVGRISKYEDKLIEKCEGGRLGSVKISDSVTQTISKTGIITWTCA